MSPFKGIFRGPLLIIPFLIVASVCSASRISGTYVNHGGNFTEMLQLTETGNGQISGVLSSVTLKDDGAVEAEHSQVEGSVDAGQITLKIGSKLLSFLVGSTLSGTVNGGTIKLQTVDSKGSLVSCVFIQGPATTFAGYADHLKSRGSEIVLNRQLNDGANHFNESVRDAEAWSAAADWHAKKISVIKSRYQGIEERMQSLIATERATNNPAARAQIFVAVNQGDIAGNQFDIEVNQLWDLTIADQGSALNTEFSKWDGKCNDAGEFQKRGATAQSANAWATACRRASAERENFIPTFKRIMEQRSEVKSLEVAAQARRKLLLTESERIE